MLKNIFNNAKVVVIFCLTVISFTAINAGTVLNPNGKVSGFSGLKFGLSESDTKVVLKENCEYSSGVNIECFKIFGKKIATVTVYYNDKNRISSTRLNWNNRTIAKMIGIDTAHFDKNHYLKFKDMLEDKYSLTQEYTGQGYVRHIFENGAIALSYKGEFLIGSGNGGEYANIFLMYRDEKQAKKYLDTHFGTDEF